jgi:NAD(P)-dependent dehydrogenase (short-subunit alcohol dehydrogenase family)
VVGRSKPALDTVVSQSHNDAMAVAADLSADDEPARVLDLVLRAFGRLDVLVSNAGAGHSGPSDELTVEDLDRVWALNVRAALLLQGRAAAHMARSGGGSIVNLSSSALSGLGNTQASLYAATKGRWTPQPAHSPPNGARGASASTPSGPAHLPPRRHRRGRHLFGQY